VLVSECVGTSFGLFSDRVTHFLGGYNRRVKLSSSSRNAAGQTDSRPAGFQPGQCRLSQADTTRPLLRQFRLSAGAVRSTFPLVRMADGPAGASTDTGCKTMPLAVEVKNTPRCAEAPLGQNASGFRRGSGRKNIALPDLRERSFGGESWHTHLLSPFGLLALQVRVSIKVFPACSEILSFIGRNTATTS